MQVCHGEGNYFNINFLYCWIQIGNRKLAGELLNSAENFSKLKIALTSGKKVDLLKVDPPLAPSVILGYDDATRIQSKEYYLCNLFRIQ